MPDVTSEKPYEFVPPIDSRFWPWIARPILPWYLRRVYGITGVECRHLERYTASLAAGHAILLAPNHCRLSDPLVLGHLVIRTHVNLFAMSSWHLFIKPSLEAFLARKLGAFSVYREGLDRQAYARAVDILEHARRPLVIFPEGALSRHNDKLMSLMDGPAAIARTAAKRRAKSSPERRVVIHPVAIRYFFQGDLEKTLTPVLAEIESHFAWQTQSRKPLLSRIRQVGEALLSLKEIEYFGRAQEGELYERVARLVDHLLVPLEDEWNVKRNGAGIVARVKNLRIAILPDMINGDISPAERDRRWRQLTDCYYAQQMSLYPKDYIKGEDNVPERVLETVERFAEDLIDQVQIRGPLRAVVEMGEAIEVDPGRPPKGDADPMMKEIERRLQSMLDQLAAESPRQ